MEIKDTLYSLKTGEIVYRNTSTLYSLNRGEVVYKMKLQLRILYT